MDSLKASISVSRRRWQPRCEGSLGEIAQYHIQLLYRTQHRKSQGIDRLLNTLCNHVIGAEGRKNETLTGMLSRFRVEIWSLFDSTEQLRNFGELGWLHAAEIGRCDANPALWGRSETPERYRLCPCKVDVY